jgi:hypothetical protein
MGGFCWNADCRTCEVVIDIGSGVEKRVLACQTMIVPGMKIVEMTKKLEFCLRDIISKPSAADGNGNQPGESETTAASTEQGYKYE